MSEEDKRIDNAPHDEEIEVSDGESVPDQDDASEASEASGGSPRVVPTESAPDGESLQFGDEFDSRDDGSPDKGGAKVPNQAYDEAVDVSSDGTHGAGIQNKQEDEEEEEESDASSASEEDNEDPGKPAPGQLGQLPPAQAHPSKSANSNMSGEEDESETSSDEDGEEEGAAHAEGYNPADYASLDVSAEVKELFQYIGRYKPQTIELETRLKPFIPDYLPAIGEIDPFLKIPRPDGKKDELGLTRTP
ncbi:intraflagellar transport complex B protein 46 C terminal-domain-containing protein [Baffinella frigidus]|nr:intraflagellar transport complex B protein 46 C terminal-domain-containing protein [Cryptophyta sp. CCMP2293]